MEYFKQEEFLKAKKQRAKALAIYLMVALVYFVIALGLFLYYRSLPYRSPDITKVKLILYPITVAFAIFSIIYLSIAFRRINRYYKFCYNLSTAKRETSTAVYLENDGKLFIKDGVDCKALVFLEWNKYKKDYFERKVFVFYEKDFPIITEKAEVEFVTQGNFLINYNVLEEENLWKQ